MIRATMMVIAVPLACGAQAVPRETERVWTVALDAKTPRQAEFSLMLPEARTPIVLASARDGDGAAISTPRCGRRPLARVAGSGWRVPLGCRLVRWSARLSDHDAAGMDASLPISAWSRRGGFWFLAERSGFLRPIGADPGGIVKIEARMPGGSIVRRRHRYPAYDQPPYYAAIGALPSAVYAHAGVTLDVYGAPPARAWMPALQQDILAIWAGWRRDVMPTRRPPPDRLAFVWLDAPKDAEPGMSASAGADTIALQMIPREGDPAADAKMRAALLLLGAHEGFHTLIGAYGQSWPAWVNESLANHFAYRAVAPKLDAGQRAFIDGQVMAPAQIALADAHAAYAKGDAAQGEVFYGKGARFWMAIERVLTTPDGPSGRLGALMRASDNFSGVAWTDPDRLAAWFDARSNGHAGPIVRCFVVTTACPAAN